MLLKTTQNSTSTNFKSIISSPTFVDKTMIIKRIIEKDRYMVISTPPKCGKSTIIDMIKTFLEIEVDAYGEPKTNRNISSDIINDTENLFCFVNNHLKITKHTEVMRKFGRTPVIGVDFKRKKPSTGIHCLYDIIKICKEVVHKCFKEHEYLLYSERLTLENKQLVRTWCDEHSYKTKIDNMFISHGLLSLSQFLHKHFGRKVFVLVDNHDFLITAASKDVEKDSELLEIVGFVYSIIGDLINENRNLVGGAFITGVSQIPEINEFNLTNFKICSFLEDNSYRELFGCSRKEVDDIVNKFGYDLDPDEIKLLYANSNGYHSKGGVELYSFNSLLECFNPKGKLITINDYPTQVLETLKAPKIKVLLNKLLLGEQIVLNVFKVMSTTDVDVRNCLRNKCSSSDDKHLLLYLMNWGLLTYYKEDVGTNETCYNIRLTSNEIKELLLDL